MSSASTKSPPQWYVPRISAVSPTGPEVNLAVGEVVDLSVELEPWQTVPSEQRWQRRGEPVLSTTLTHAGLEPRDALHAGRHPRRRHV